MQIEVKLTVVRDRFIDGLCKFVMSNLPYLQEDKLLLFQG